MTSTTLPLSPTGAAAPELAATPAHVATMVAAAAAAHVPSPGPLETGTPDELSALDTAVWSAAAVCELAGSAGSVVILVGEQLTGVLAESPIGALDLGAALQPAFDAAGASVGTQPVSAARSLEPADALALLRDGARVVPLIAAGQVYAVVVADLTPTAAAPSNGSPLGIEILHGVMLDVTVELGRTRLPVRDLLALTPGSVLELDRAAGSPVDLLVNGRLVARGEVVVIDEDFGLRVTELVSADPTGR